MEKQYTLAELITSTGKRIAYNVELAAKALVNFDVGEYLRFMDNAKTMLADIECAANTQNPDLLMDNRDW